MHYAVHLSKDQIMKMLIRQHGMFRLQKQKNLWLYLCYSIMSQQLSTKVADVIRRRFVDLYGNEPTPLEVLETNAEKLRSIGLSNAKVQYVQNVARFELTHGISHKKLAGLSNEEVILYLTRIKGVGKWTTEMLMMFALGREDVFAQDDLGLQQSMIELYRLKCRKKKTLIEALQKISAPWAPYRTYACLYLWRHRDAG